MSHDLVIVGAGAAGLAAARTAGELGLDYVLLEASHRIGGRGYTEEIAPGVAFDLGCHWMHSASLNPFVAIADRFGFTYRTGTYPRGLFVDDHWASEEERASLDAFMDQCAAAIAAAARAGGGLSVADVTERENRWTPVHDHFVTLGSSADPDQVAVEDSQNYQDTGENWPIKDGFGNLIARYAEGIPVTLNCAVRRIDWTGRTIELDTPKGKVAAKRVLVTVSTGILGAGDIRFDPALPAWKEAAIAALPLGTHNRIGLLFERDIFGPDCPRGGVFVDFVEPGREGMAFALNAFGQNYAVGYTGGRHAVWLERAGQAVAVDLALERLVKAFGSEIRRRVTRTIVTAWNGDPWTKGSYSAAQPGQAHQRAELGRPVDDRLFFAGEATSTNFMSTAQGAYLTGIAAASDIARSLGLVTAA
ncbi:MAG: NAD(P)/FAD-dependent oxidoreductase [Dongiaceae bacterium]